MGHLNGEWELEHDYMCSTCGEIFDELREVWHHKWDAHPRCLVSHVTLPRKESVYLPPLNLIHPQLGRQLKNGQGAANRRNQQSFKNRKLKGGKGSKNSKKENTTASTLVVPDMDSSFECKKCLQDSSDASENTFTKFDTKDQFYVHILECGGDNDWQGKRDKKKKNGKGGRNQTSKPKGKNTIIAVFSSNIS